jgi:hypothetical protein
MMKEDEMSANVLMQTVHASPSWQAKAEVTALAAENCASVSNNNRGEECVLDATGTYI